MFVGILSLSLFRSSVLYDASKQRQRIRFYEAETYAKSIGEERFDQNNLPIST